MKVKLLVIFLFFTVLIFSAENSKEFSAMNKEERFNSIAKRTGKLRERCEQKKYIPESEVKSLIHDCKTLIEEIDQTDLGSEKNAIVDLKERQDLKKGTKDLKAFLRGLQLNPGHQIEKLYRKIKE